MGRKRSTRWRSRALSVLVLIAAGAALYVWWESQHWAPERSAFPAQGVLVGEDDPYPDFAGLHAVGADFAYLEASRGADGRDPSFASNLDQIAQTGLPFGAVHYYDPCVSAEIQAANFVTIVPRSIDQLPPAIALEKLATECGDPISEASLESELTTFLNQVEGHVGQPAIMKVSEEFEARYLIASRIERGLWLSGDWVEPEYGGRPWTLWTANSGLRLPISEERFRWVVAQP